MHLTSRIRVLTLQNNMSERPLSNYERTFGVGAQRWDSTFGRGYDSRGASWELTFGREPVNPVSEDEITPDGVDRVLAEIERLEATDPTFKRPSWVPDVASRRNLHGILDTEHSLFPDERSFEGALQNYFPRPRDNG
jgi:hypothetical protein